MMGDRPDFVVVGHVTLDLTERGPVPGGAALYGAVTASRLGWRARLLTRGAPPQARGLLRELESVVDGGAEVSTTFGIRYWREGREEREMGSRLRGSKGGGLGTETPFRPAATPITPISIFPHQGGRGKGEGRDKKGEHGLPPSREQRIRGDALTSILSQDGRGGKKEGGEEMDSRLRGRKEGRGGRGGKNEGCARASHQEEREKRVSDDSYAKVGDGRVVTVRGVAPPIEEGMLPGGWGDASVVMLGPVFGEVPESMAGRFSGALVGIAPQGWLRRAGESGRIEPSGWYDGSVLERVDVVVLSELDVVDGRIPERWLEHEAIFILTRGRQGAVMRCEDRWHSLPAYPAVEVDPTGAGDVFAAAFLIRYFETKDAYVAGLFASCAASLSVEGSGAGAIPTREQVERRMSRYAGMKAKALNSDKSKEYESGVLDDDV